MTCECNGICMCMGPKTNAPSWGLWEQLPSETVSKPKRWPTAMMEQMIPQDNGTYHVIIIIDDDDNKVRLTGVEPMHVVSMGTNKITIDFSFTGKEPVT